MPAVRAPRTTGIAPPARLVYVSPVASPMTSSAT
jgi:hypothetical protein